MRSVLRSILGIGITLSGVTAVHAQPATETPVTVSIQSQPLAAALNQWADQTGYMVLIAADDAVAVGTAPPVEGAYSPEAALKLLLANSGLRYELVSPRTVSIRRAQAEAGERQGRGELLKTSHVVNSEGERTGPTSSAADRTRTAQVQQQAGESDASEDTSSSRAVMLEEVVVTGSHIRGAQNLSSPVISFDREDIEASGFATTQQFIQSLPQNLSSISDATSGSLNGGTDLTYDGAGVNLRGLGSDATLVLLNGRRMAPTGQGNFVDLSLIPLGAIERVDVLTDGASAIYGSDAVGGVVNMVLRDDFEGAETRVRYGSVTEGSHDEWQAGQALGHTWGSGNAFLSYEFYHREDLDGASRSAFQPSDFYSKRKLIPEQKRHALLGVLSQSISERVGLSSDWFYSRRKTTSGYESSGSWSDVDTEVTQYGGSLGATVDLDRDWQGRLSVLLDRSESDSRFANSGVSWATYYNESRVWSADLTADGPVGRAPGGEIRLALGGQFREERFRETLSFDLPMALERDVAASYAELIVPWVSAQNRRTGVEQLELTLAGRYERYSDFGSTFNPKIGLAWAPVGGLNVRGTWGTSFKAPLLRQLNDSASWGYLYTDAFRDVGGTTPTIWRMGNGVGLDPEESTNWTVGFDLAPPALSGLEFSATYFNIHYTDRIRTPFPPGYDQFGVLLDPMYSIIVTRTQDAAEVAALLESMQVYCYTPGYDPECANMPAPGEITAIVDDRLRNLAGVRMSGIDFSFRYGWDNQMGTWGVQLSGTRLLKNVEQIVPGAPEVTQMNDVWRPVDLRLRNSISFSRGSLNVIAFINYTDGYHDRRTYLLGSSRRHVPSWTTVDLTLQYDFGQVLAKRGLANTSLTVTANNILDRSPPYVESNVGLHYDGVNANPLGRFLGAQVIVQW